MSALAMLAALLPAAQRLASAWPAGNQRRASGEPAACHGAAIGAPAAVCTVECVALENRYSSSSSTGEDERTAAAVPEAWGRGPLADPAPAPVHRLIARQAELRPDATAVVCGETSISYGDLVARARVLAARLGARSLGRGAVVAVQAERSIDLVAALLGVLTAGYAYLALDCGQPAERTRLLLRDADAALLITEADRSAAEPDGTDAADEPPTCPVLRLDEAFDAPTGSDVEARPAADAVVGPDDLAYLCYTSGSTGAPKGVCVTHRGVTRLVAHDDWDFGPQDAFLQLAPVAFDASTFEIWTALAAGSRLVLHPPGPVAAEELDAVVERHGVTVLHLTAGLFRRVADTEPGLFGRLRRFLTGGDVVSAEHLREIQRAYPDLAVTHAYGPTENTTFTTCWTADPEVTKGPLPIGSPVRGTTVYVLDDDLEPVRVGATGQLYTGGDGVARGYLGRPGHTAERFLPDPAGPPGARMYATGDLARWRPDGTLEFLGRADGQFKIRGFRVESAEVEAHLRRDSAVRDAVALARDGVDGERILVGYVVAGKPGADVAGLRARLRRRVPEHLVPAVIVELPALPVSGNGKIDRAALPAPAAAALEATLEPPETELEESIAAVWREVLGTEVGIHRNFFEAGGTSFALMSVRARLQQVLKRPVATVGLFENPTIHQLARHLARGAAQPGRERSRAARGPGGADRRQALAGRARRIAESDPRGDRGR